MDETETPSGAALAPEAPAVESGTTGIDLSNRPDVEWLNTVEGEIDDIDLVLKCLGRDSAKICETCDTAQGQGALESRPMLARCASTKQPR